MTTQELPQAALPGPLPAEGFQVGSGRFERASRVAARLASAAQPFVGAGIYVIALLIGVFLFAYPFFSAALVQQPVSSGQAGLAGVPSPLALAIIVGLCLAAIIVESQGEVMSAKLVALLGVLVAINSMLRLAETALPGPGGFTPIFMLIILSGYVFGARFGFLMGALTMLVSALVTAGIGPWLPNQMFTAGWMGMAAGWLGWLRARGAGSAQRGAVRRSTLHASHTTLEVVLLAAFGAVCGLAYGVIMNLWFWPFQAGDPAQSWQAGLSVSQALQRYLVFYVATSLVWDVLGAFGNIVLIWLFGMATLKALRRFKARFLFQSSASVQ